MALLSKSKYLLGIQCPKYLWIACHQPEKIPPYDEETKHRFSQGYEVESYAKKSFPDGIDIPTDDFKASLINSRKSLDLKKPLFEAAFSDGEIYSRTDVLDPQGDEWDLIEIKSGASVKDINVQDVAFQKHVFEKCGLKIRKCFVMHVNSKYVRNGEIDPTQLITKEDVTARVDLIDVKFNVEKLIKVMNSDVCPEIKIGPQCADPYGCPLEDHCWGFLPESSIFEFYNIRKRKAFQWLDEGHMSLLDVPLELLDDKQGIQHKCEGENVVHVDKKGIKGFLDTLQEPIFYMDFETFMSAIPLFDGIRPYQQIPFQFSVHVEDKHHSFLFKDASDPRLEFLKSLKNVLGTSGTIVTYNKSFEIRMLREMATIYPEYSEWVESVVKRIVDLADPFKKFYYYNPKQKGKYSLKKVLPAITGKDYSALDIAGGNMAIISYLSAVYGDGYDKEKIFSDLEKYCSLDTEGMVWIVRELRELT
jgi:hypothetical protein